LEVGRYLEYCHLFFVTHIISETGGGKNKLRTGSSTKYQEPFPPGQLTQ
jgi:hypothetical protein